MEIVLAGTGTVIDDTPHLLNLNLYYNYDETDMDILGTAINAASELLHCATDGQMQIGSVRVSKNSNFQDKADIWVLAGEGGAYANPGGLGTSGLHLTIYRDQHRFTNNDGPDNNERGQFGIVHEMGHYVFNLYDEYPLPAWGYPSSYCTSTTSTVACIMDGGTTVNNDRTEFCTVHGGGLSTEHVETPLSMQQDMHGESCWETIADYCSSEYGITLNQPTSETGHTNPACPTGHTDPAYIVIGDKLRYVICIDRSYSMVGNKMDIAKIAADLFVDLVHDDAQEYLGVTSFSDNAIVEFPLEEVTTTPVPTTKERARTAIGAIVVDSNTAMGDGLRLSLNEITDYGTFSQDDAAIEAIILLSDGYHNYGIEDPEDVIPDLRDRGVRTFTIGLGDPNAPVYPLDEDTLQDISDQTGALYSHAPTETSLSTIFTEYCAEVRGDEVCSEETGSVSPGDSEEQTVFIDEFTDETTFVVHWPLHWPKGGDIFDVTLVDPLGNVIDKNEAVINPRIKHLETDYYEFYRVNQPTSGSWKIIINANNITYYNGFLPVQEPRFSYISQVLSSARGVDFSPFTPNPSFTFPQGPVIKASVVAGVPVAKASVTGIITGPDGRQVDITLYDDGNFQLHGDAKPDDGVYCNRFLDFDENGSYSMQLIVDNAEGVQATPDEVVPADWTPKPIPPFVRVSKSTFLIDGVPDSLPTPTITSIDPVEGKCGQTMKAIIYGNDFIENAVVSFSGTGVTVNRATCLDQGRIEASITISSDATPGVRNLVVTNPGGGSDVATEVLTVVESKTILDQIIDFLKAYWLYILILIIIIIVVLILRGRR